jgi:hypothetical protein
MEREIKVVQNRMLKRISTFSRMAIICMALSVSACASPQFNYQPETVEVSFPTLGEKTTVGVGETMVRQGKYVERDSVLFNQQITVGAIGTYTFAPGYYSQVGQDASSKFYLPERSAEGGQVTKGALTDPFQAIQIMNDDKSICGVSTLGGKVCTSEVSFNAMKRPNLESNGFQQSLIYSGRIGTRINIGYREFSNSTARPAFNNDVEYDLNEDNEIGYKGALIRVLDATNRGITYEVIKNFNTK